MVMKVSNNGKSSDKGLKKKNGDIKKSRKGCVISVTVCLALLGVNTT